MGSNPYEDLQRQRKAMQIAVALAAHDFSAALVRTFNDEQKQMAVKIAGTRPASQKTWDLVAEMIDAMPGGQPSLSEEGGSPISGDNLPFPEDPEPRISTLSDLWGH